MNSQGDSFGEAHSPSYEHARTESIRNPSWGRARPHPRTGEAERRQLTVLFCDIVDSTPLTEKLDPEELRNVLEAYRACVMEVVLAQNGHIARYFGDGILVYFGYPIAHEDAAHRAVRAALGIVAAIDTLNPSLHATFGVDIRARLSIETGLVVVWHMAAENAPEPIDIVGQAPNLAAKVQNLAAPNSIVIGATTHQLVQGFFTCEALGTSTLRGISQPVALYDVSGEIPRQSRLDVARESGLTPFIGRVQEVELLKKLWRQSCNGKGQALLIEGEAGIGKSRCVQLLKEYVEAEAGIMECRGSPYYQNSPLYPIKALLQQHLLQFISTDTPETRRAKLEDFLNDTEELRTDGNFALLAEWLEVPTEPLDRHNDALGGVTSNSPEQRRQQLLEILVQVFLKVAERKPMLFVVEDLHWIDPSSTEWLTLFIAHLENARILTVLTSRSAGHYGVLQQDSSGQAEDRINAALEREALDTLLQGGSGKWTTLFLKPLTPRQVKEMIRTLAGDTPVPANALRQIVEMTEGVPLFVEELTRMVLEGEESVTAAISTDIPATLQALLTARLDRLGPAKEIVQLGATLGREWTGELLHQVALHSGKGGFLYPPAGELEDTPPEGAETLESRLDTLVAGHILDRRERAGAGDRQTLYTFRHPLVRETAYQSLLKSTRQHYHGQIATVLTREFGAIAHAQPELVAHHWTEAGLPERAVEYWQQAGQRALERSANVEGVRFLTQGLAALKTLPATPERAQRELVLQTTLGPALIATKGYASVEVETTYTRARELLDKLDTATTLSTRNVVIDTGPAYQDNRSAADRLRAPEPDRRTARNDSVTQRNVTAHALLQSEKYEKLRFPVLFGLWLSYLVRGRLLSARELGEQCLVIAKQQGSQAFEVEAHRALGATLYYLSEFKNALTHLEAGLVHYHPQHAFLHYVAEPGMTLLAYSAPVLWCIGYPEQAVQRIREAEKIGQDRKHPFSEAVLLYFATVIYQYRGEVEKVDAYATRLLSVCQEHGFTVWEAAGTVMKGWALAMGDKYTPKEGIAMIQKGIEKWKTMRAEVLMPFFLALLADAYHRDRHPDVALQTLDSAIDVVKKTGERAYLAELYRRKGTLYRAKRHNPNAGLETPEEHEHRSANDEKSAEAAASFEKALTVARAQGAKYWELRAAISLSQLYQAQGKPATEIHLRLKPIVDWFTEGLDTPDLKVAKQLLEA